MIRFARILALTLVVLFGSFVAAWIAGLLADPIVDLLVPLSGAPSLERELIEAGVILASLFVYFFLVIWAISRRRSHRELAPIEARLVELRENAAGGSSLDVRANMILTELKQLFTIARNHARYSFTASLTAMSTGFVSIIIALVFFLRDGTENLELSYLSGAAGLISEFIGGSFLFIYRASSSKVDRIRDRLEAQELVLMALLASDQMESQALRDSARERAVATLLELASPLQAARKGVAKVLGMGHVPGELSGQGAANPSVRADA